MNPEDQRKTDRVHIAIPLHISAVDVSGEKFSEQIRTLTISRHGATVVMKRQMAAGLEVTIRPAPSKSESRAQIVGQIGGQPGSYIYGLSSLEPSVNLWGIKFPPLTDSQNALVRILLECLKCQAREVAYLNELESEVFEGNGSLPRACAHCGGWTIWKQTSNELSDQGSRITVDTAAGSSGTADSAQNKRKDVRVQVKMKVCIRHPGFEEEIVEANDISRGGLSFVSSKAYLEGSRIEVALSYSTGQANIFVAARISRVKQVPGKKNFAQYGVAYIRYR